MDMCNAWFLLILLKITVIQGFSFNITNNKRQIVTANSILEATGRIIEACFSQYSRNIFISDAWDKEENEILRRTYELFHPLTLINLQDNKTFEVNNTNKFLSAYTERNYVIVITSKKNLLIALQKLRNSKLWDHGGLFIVVYKNFIESCQRNEDLLELIWSFNILNILLLCGDFNDENYLYTFNPYTNIAPKFWTANSNQYRRRNHIWIFNHRLKDPLIPSKGLLNDLDFDKARNLGGYIIKVGVGHSTSPKYDIKKTGVNRYLGKMGALTRVLWDYLNGTIEYRHYPKLCIQNKKNENCDIFKDLLEGKIDYLINQLFMNSIWKYHTLPKENMGLCALAAMDKKTIYEKFLLTFTKSFWVTMGSTAVLIIIFLKYLLNRSLVTCMLETLRMFLVMPSHGLPQHLFKRSLFAMLIFLTMTLNWNFQSRLSALFIVPDLHPYIDSLQDLENSRIPVYGHADFREYFFSSSLYYRYKAIDDFNDCIKKLETGHLVACIFPCKEKSTLKQIECVHVTKRSIQELFIATFVRRDWPLFLKINELIHKLYESGLLKLFKNRELELFPVAEAKEQFVKLSISSLYISFFMFAFGLIIASCVLIMEIITKTF